MIVYWMQGGVVKGYKVCLSQPQDLPSIIMHMVLVASKFGSAEKEGGRPGLARLRTCKSENAHLGCRRVDCPTEPAYPPRRERRVQMLLPSLSLEIIEGAMTIQLLVAERIKGSSRSFKLKLTRLNC